MAKIKLILELGNGADLHGGDNTKAAKRAVDDAIRHGSLVYLGEIMKTGVRPKLYVDVTIAAPKPDTVNTDVVLEALPFGEKTIKVVAGGMEVDHGGSDTITVCNAAVLVIVES